MSQTESRGLAFRRRIPLIIALIAGAVVWKGGLGYFATARDVTWRVALPYGDIRKVELQIWRDDVLLRREERSFPTGIASELRQDVVMRTGPHRALAKVWMKDAVDPRVFERRFDPGAEPALAIDLGP